MCERIAKMRILIAYTTRTGTTKECVERLCRELDGLTVDTARLDEEIPNLDDYDIVVLGSPVRFGKLPKTTAAYLKEHEDALCEKPHALFLCCGLAHEYEYYVERLYSDALRATAISVMNFGGTLDYKGQRWWEKLLIHAIRSSIRENEIEDGEYTPEFPGILPENIGKMATYIRDEIKKLRS